MTRQRYSTREALNRILRLFQGKALPTDAPDTVTGDFLSENESISDLAELLGGSLPNETATLPSAIVVPASNIPTGSFSAPGHVHPTYDLGVYEDDTFRVTGTVVVYGSNLDVSVTGTTFFVSVTPTPKFGNVAGGSYSYFESDGTFRVTGSATTFEDLRIDGLNTRIGVVAPTDEAGFRGDANFLVRNFVHNQADEVQFDVQFPHAWQEGSTIYPHVHFSPWITGTASVQAAKFILEYYWANVDGLFPASPSQLAMEYTWTGSFQWSHRIADNDAGIVATGKGFSSIMKCRLYRDNTVANNLAGKVTFLYFDVHYIANSIGSADEYMK